MKIRTRLGLVTLVALILASLLGATATAGAPGYDWWETPTTGDVHGVYIYQWFEPGKTGLSDVLETRVVFGNVTLETNIRALYNGELHIHTGYRINGVHTMITWATIPNGQDHIIRVLFKSLNGGDVYAISIKDITTDTPIYDEQIWLYGAQYVDTVQTTFAGGHTRKAYTQIFSLAMTGGFDTPVLTKDDPDLFSTASGGGGVYLFTFYDWITTYRVYGPVIKRKSR